MFSLFIHSKDRGVFLVCSAIGFLLSLVLRPALWAPYLGLLLTYHLFLAWSIGFSERKTSRAFGLLATIAAHGGFVILLVVAKLAIRVALDSALASVEGPARLGAYLVGVKIARVVEILVCYGLATGEFRWLFPARADASPDAFDASAIGAPYSTPAPQMQFATAEPAAPEYLQVAALPPSGPLAAATGADHFEWLQYKAQQTATKSNSRLSPAEDFEQWLRARGKTQYPYSQP